MLLTHYLQQHINKFIHITGAGQHLKQQSDTQQTLNTINRKRTAVRCHLVFLCLSELEKCLCLFIICFSYSSEGELSISHRDAGLQWNDYSGDRKTLESFCRNQQIQNTISVFTMTSNKQKSESMWTHEHTLTLHTNLIMFHRNSETPHAYITPNLSSTKH